MTSQVSDGSGAKAHDRGSDAPLFLVGCGRSGTTMLRLMVDSHPDLAIPGESHFIPGLWRLRRTFTTGGVVDGQAVLDRILRRPHVHHWGVDESAFRAAVSEMERPSYAAVVDAVFMAYAAQHGKSRWGDKTPIYVRHVEFLARLFPTARFVHVIRDGRDVALSYLSVPWGPSTIWSAARKWRRDVSAGLKAGRALGRDRYFEVRYEKLVEDPKSVLTELCRFADLPFDERMLDFHRDAGDRIQNQPAMLGYHASVTKPVTGGLRSWRNQMGDSDVGAFELIAGKLLAELGYPRRYSSIGWRGRLEGTLRMVAIEAAHSARRARKELRLVRTTKGRPSATR